MAKYSIRGELGEDHITTMAIVGGQGGIQGSVHQFLHALVFTEAQAHHGRGSSSAPGGRAIFSSAGDRGISDARSPLPIDAVYHSGEDQSTSNSRLQKDKHIYSNAALQDGRCPGVEGAGRGERFHGEDRFEGCVYCVSHTPRLAEIFFIRAPWNSVFIQDTTVWRQYESTGVQQTAQICGRAAEEDLWDPIRLLSQRYLCVGENGGRDEETYFLIPKTIDGIGFPNQLEEDRFEPKDDSRIPRVSVRHQRHDNQGTEGQDGQTGEPSEASNNQDFFMLMGSRSAGQDHRHATGYWRCITPYQTCTTGTYGEFVVTRQQLGGTLYTGSEGTRGRAVVGASGRDTQWIASAQANRRRTTLNRICRFIRFGMGCSIQVWRIFRILDQAGERRFYKRTRTQDHTYCIGDSCKTIQGWKTVSLHRQHHGFKVCKQSRGYRYGDTTRIGTRHSRHMFGMGTASSISPHSRRTKHSGRQTKQATRTDTRVETSFINLQETQSAVGSTDDRRICGKAQQQAAGLLEHPNGWQGASNGCISSKVANKGVVSAPAMEAYTEGHSKVHTRSSTRSSIGDAVLADSILVANGHATLETSTVGAANQQEIPADRVEVIRRSRRQRGVSAKVTDYLQKARRTNTSKAYNRYWARYSKWCRTQEPVADPGQYDPNRLVEFLVAHSHFSYDYLNNFRSGIASVYKTTHPEKAPIASTDVVKDFFASKRRNTIKMPNKTQEIWDVKVVLDEVRSWGTNEGLDDQQLQKKTIMLLCLATMWRPRSDIGRLQHRDVEFVHEGAGIIIGVTLIVREPKETQVKVSKLGPIEDKEMCPVFTLKHWITRSGHWRQNLPHDHSLFLAHIDSQPHSCKPSTVAKWVTEILTSAGVDTKIFKAHSTRAAASTKAVEQGSTIEGVKEHGNWSHKSQTFERYYYRPRNQHKRGQSMVTTIFSSTENNNTTSEAGVQAPTIALGTTSNREGAETEAGEVVGTRPWYQRLLFPTR